MATKARAAKKPKSKRRRGVMTTLAMGMKGLYGRVKKRLARKPKKAAKQDPVPAKKSPAKKPAAKARKKSGRTRKAAKAKTATP